MVIIRAVFSFLEVAELSSVDFLRHLIYKEFYMLRIRLLRVGKKNSPSFRLVVTPRRTAAKTGRFLEVLGFYNPLQHTKDFKKERIQHWLSVGAQASDTVHNLLVREGVTEGGKVAVHKQAKKAASREVAETETKPEAEETPKADASAEEVTPEETTAAPEEDSPDESEAKKEE